MLQSMPSLFSYGAVRLLPGQSVSLEGITGKAMTSKSWTMSFHVRVLSPGAGGQLFTLGSKNDLVINLGGKPDGATVSDNDLKVEFKCQGNKYTTVSSLCDLEVGVWHHITMTVAVTAKDKGNPEYAEVLIYTDGSPFGDPDREEDSLKPIRVDGYYGSTDTSHPVLGGNVHAEFTDIVFWDSMLDETLIIEGNYQLPGIKPVYAADFSSFDAGNMNYSLDHGAQRMCIDPGLLFGGGVAIPDPQDALNPGGDLSRPFSIQAWVYSTPDISRDDVPFQALVANGEFSSVEGFAFGVQYAPDIESFALAAKLPGMSEPVFDARRLLPDIWYNVALVWDGVKLNFYVNGEQGIPTVIEKTSVIQAKPDVSLGAAVSTDPSIGYNNFLRGYLQALGIWERALSSDELQHYQEPMRETSEDAVAFYDLNSAEFSNFITGSRLAFKGTTGLSETATSDYVPSPGRGIEPPPREDFVNLSNIQELDSILSAESSPEVVNADSGVRITESDVEKIQQHFELILKRIPARLQPALRLRMRNNLQKGMQRANTIKGVPAGCSTSEIEGDFRVFYFHTVDGPIETMRVPAEEISDCTAWVINMSVAMVALFLSIIGVGFAAKNLTSILAKNAALMAATLEEVGAIIATPAGIVRFIAFLLAKGKLAVIVSEAITGTVSWWKLAFTAGSIMLNIIGIFATGGWYLAFILAQMALNLVVVVYTFDQRPRGCLWA